MSHTYTSHFIFRYRVPVIIGTIVLGVAGALYAMLAPVKFDTSISFSINRIHLQQTEQYQYDGYYAIQASDLFSQTVLSWFLTPSVLLEIYDRAQITPEVSTIEELTTRIKAKKYSAQNIVVRFTERDRPTAEKISAALIDVVEERAQDANQTVDNQPLFEVVGATPVIIENRPSLPLMAVIGLAAGAILSILITYVIDLSRTSASVENSNHGASNASHG